jgi:hypothetical protein
MLCRISQKPMSYLKSPIVRRACHSMVTIRHQEMLNKRKSSHGKLRATILITYTPPRQPRNVQEIKH